MNDIENNGLFNQRTLDALAAISFIISVANYQENVSQSDVQDVMKSALTSIHDHLEEQDRKIDKILESVKEVNMNE